MNINPLYSTATNAATTANSATAKSADTSSSSSTTSADASDDITSTGFMTLLVTEMKNQDPTQPTDPNAYVQQLVGVNSLQQLIQINSGIGTLDGTSGTTAS